MAKAIVSGNETNHLAEIQRLRSTIAELNEIAQKALGQIGTVADLALLALESPRGQTDTIRMAEAFKMVSSHSTEAWEAITGVAGRVGCSYFDETEGERFDARQAAAHKAMQAVAHD